MSSRRHYIMSQIRAYRNNATKLGLQILVKYTVIYKQLAKTFIA